MRKCESGITLVSLVVTILVILILSTVALSSGKEALENTRLTTFTAQMKIMQIQVNNLYDKYKNNGSVTIDNKTYIGQGNENENDLGIDEIGIEVTSADYQDILESLNISNLEGYRFYSSDLLKKLGIEGVEGTFLVNVPNRKVISVEGLKYRGEMCYSLEQLPDTLYNVEYDNANDDLGIPTIENVKIEANDADTWRVKVEGIEYSNYVEKGTVKYGKKEIKEDGSQPVVNIWNSAQGTEFIISEPGIYSVKVIDAAGRESDEKEFYAYVKNGLVLYYDGINNTGTGTYNSSATIWKDLSGNNNDGKLTGGEWQNNKSLKLDGKDDFVSTKKELALGGSKKLTLEFIDIGGEIYNNSEGTPNMLFETSINCNYNNGAFYINTNEMFNDNLDGYLKYNDNRSADINIAMRWDGFKDSNGKVRRNFTRANQILSDKKNAAYTITFNSTKKYKQDTYTSIYKNSVETIDENYERYTYEQDGTTKYSSLNNDVTDLELGNYNLYIGARGDEDADETNGETPIQFSKMNLASLRIYNRVLTDDEIKINYEIDKIRYGIQ